VVFVRKRSAVIANVGDSRVYAISRKTVEAAHHRPPLVAAMVENGPQRRGRTPTPTSTSSPEAIGTMGELAPVLKHRVPRAAACSCAATVCTTRCRPRRSATSRKDDSTKRRAWSSAPMHWRPRQRYSAADQA
jgi:hypothetical protein